MKVFKFGGASVKDIDGINNLAQILKNQDEDIVVVISAMGKMTNAFEALHLSYFNKQQDILEKYQYIYDFHMCLVHDLFSSDDEVFSKVEALFQQLSIHVNSMPSRDFNYEYDQVISFGELLSTTIISNYLSSIQIQNQWIDIRQILQTDSRWSEAKIDWDATKSLMQESITFDDTKLYITQGFIGGTTTGHTTTLGREGSDFSAAIIASVLSAERVDIWKDVPGVLNADPQYFTDTQKIDKMTYHEAVELTYFGAKVIHPKTLKPLENSKIPLHVRSFIDHTQEGTLISYDGQTDQHLPIRILKKDQMLITIGMHDMSFMNEESLSSVFQIFSDLNFKINLIQHSALNVSLSVNRPKRRLNELLDSLRRHFVVRYNEGLELLTIRHFTEDMIKEEVRSAIYIEQRTRNTARFLVKSVSE